MAQAIFMMARRTPAICSLSGGEHVASTFFALPFGRAAVQKQRQNNIDIIK